MVFAMQCSVKLLGCFFINPMNAANVLYWSGFFRFGAIELEISTHSGWKVMQWPHTALGEREGIRLLWRK